MELNKEILKGHIDTMILAILEKNDSYGFEIAKNVLETFFYLYLLVFHCAIILKKAKSFSRYYAALFL